MSGSHKEFPKKAVFIQLGLAALVGIGFLFADKPAVHAMAEKVTKPIVAAASKVLAPIGKVEVKEEKMASAARTGEEVYASGCGTCHDNGVAGAPKLDDKASWETRLSSGFTTLVASAIKGKGGMPARGGNPDNTDSEMELAVSHMIKKAGIELVAKSAAGNAAAPAITKPEETAKTEEAPKVEETAAVETKTEEAPKVEETATVETKTEEAPKVEETAAVETKTEEAPKVEETAAVETKTEEAPKVEETTSIETKTEEAPKVEETTAVETKTEEVVAVKAEKIDENAAEVKTDTMNAVASTATAVATKVDHSKGEEIYKNSCFACHNSGVAGSPKIADKAAWTSRIAMGSDSMYEAAIKGKGAMPAKGGNMSISDDDIKAAVDYMVSESM